MDIFVNSYRCSNEGAPKRALSIYTKPVGLGLDHCGESVLTFIKNTLRPDYEAKDRELKRLIQGMVLRGLIVSRGAPYVAQTAWIR
jgi:hypothetical protein